MKSLEKKRHVHLLLMKITLTNALLVSLFFTGYAGSVFGQELLKRTVTIHASNIRIKKILNLIEEQAQVKISYSSKALDAQKRADINSDNETIESVFQKLFGNEVRAAPLENHILLLKADEAAPIGNFTLEIALTVQGVVRDENGQPLPGVNVLEKGTANGTITDVEGGFSLEAESDASVLVFSFIGYESKEVVVGSQVNLEVTLLPDVKKLEEVVVMGYGMKKKSDITGAIASLTTDEIVKSKATNAQEALQGRLSGVDVKRSSGKPGADMTIEIRGVNSIYGNTQPLFVVDGIPVANINDINPSDIERMDVLKDASSTAIYGSRGANGVVIVSTKRGIRGRTKVNYDGYFGVVNAYNLPKMMDGAEFVKYAREFFNTAGTNTTPPKTYTDFQIFSPTERDNIESGNYANWINLIQQTGTQSNHNLSITGGDDKTTYFLSTGYQNYQGAIKVENTKKYTLKVGMDKTVTDWFKFGASIYSAYADFNLGSGEVFRSAYRLRPTGSAYNPDGTNRFFAYENELQISNPLFDLDNDIRITQYVRMLPNLFVESNLLKGLKFRTSFTPDITFQRSGTYSDTYSKSGAGAKPNSATNGSNHIFNYTLDNLLTYNNEIGNHIFDITLGNSLNYYQTDNNLITVSGLPYRSLWYNVGSATSVTINGTIVPPSTTVSSNYTKQNISSFFFRANYTLKGRYLLTVTGRTDGNSIFADGHKWGFFPSVALGWITSEESFLKNITFINFLKMRFSFGKSGNAALNGSYFYPYVTQSSVATSFYDFNGSTANGSTLTALANKDLTWEKTTEYNAGLELNVLSNRIGLTLECYNKTARGTLLPQQIPVANGYTSIVSNIGSIRNSGIEIGLNTTNVKLPNFNWTTNINFSKNRNQILDLFGNGANDVGNTRFIGEKARVLYNYNIIGVWQTNEAMQAAVYRQKPGQYKIQDVNGDNQINANDRVVLGSDIPNWFGGITNTFAYKNVDFGITVYARQGTKQQSTFLDLFMNNDQQRARFNAYQRDYWTPTNPTNTWANNAIEQDATRRISATYQNSSYTKISNITLGYTLPKDAASKIKLNHLRWYFTAYNPFLFTKFIGWDPETADLNSFGLQDFRSRTFMLGINASL